ncbi:MAG: DMT family transporter [Pseudomonadota bacterium]
MNGSPAITLSLVMFLAGIGIPVMAALNGGLGARLGNPAEAATILFAVAFVISVFVLVIQPKPIAFSFSAVPTHYFGGGLFVAFYVVSVTFIAPIIGVGNAIVLVLLGQTLASALIDHFGLLGAKQLALTPVRCVGLTLIAVGVLLASKTNDTA